MYKLDMCWTSGKLNASFLEFLELLKEEGLFLGGSSGIILASTIFYDHDEGEWIIGPSLMQARNWHAVGIVTDEVTGEHFVAVTGGSYYSDDRVFLDSTEILQDGEWVQGKRNDTLSCGYF